MSARNRAASCAAYPPGRRCLGPGLHRLAPPRDAALAIPCLIELTDVPRSGTEGDAGIEGFSHPLEPPPLDEAGFRRWPLHEVADRRNLRYGGRLLAFSSIEREDGGDGDDGAQPPDESLTSSSRGPTA